MATILSILTYCCYIDEEINQTINFLEQILTELGEEEFEELMDEFLAHFISDPGKAVMVALCVLSTSLTL